MFPGLRSPEKAISNAVFVAALRRMGYRQEAMCAPEGEEEIPPGGRQLLGAGFSRWIPWLGADNICQFFV